MMKILTYCQTAQVSMLFLFFYLITPQVDGQIPKKYPGGTQPITAGGSNSDLNVDPNLTNTALLSLKGSNEIPPAQPMELLLPDLVSCGLLVYEAIAAERDFSLGRIKPYIDLVTDPNELKDENSNLAFPAFRVRLEISGSGREHINYFLEAIKTRCPVYQSLERVTPVKLLLERQEAGSGWNVLMLIQKSK